MRKKLTYVHTHTHTHTQYHRTGFGHPLWQETHPPATSTASAVIQLLEAGATVRGRTHMDELAYSLNGMCLCAVYVILCEKVVFCVCVYVCVCVCVCS
jgi:hypothetical protein